MAAVNLSGASVSPWIYRKASQGTTWQEFQIPDWARSIVVTPDAAARVAFSEAGAAAGTPETPADGAAVGSHYQLIAAGSSFEFTRIGSLRSASIFVAADSGTANIVVMVSA